MNKIILNKIVFLLASVVAAATFTTEASALPLFARQTGMECAACHFQHFPMLTAFGRSFKSGAYTMVGAQEKVEGDNLSIPAVLNMAVLSTAGYTKDNSAATVQAPGATNVGAGDGQFYVPGSGGEFSLFIGGRTSDFSGALAEVGLLNDGTMTAGVTSAKIPMLWEVADGTRAGIVPFTTDGQGASYGFETLNTGANAIHTMLFVGGDVNGMIAPALSAQQYIGTGAAATGIAGVVNNESYFINLTKFNQVAQDTGGAKLGSTYARAAYIFDMAGWDSAVGVQSWSGSSNDGAGAADTETKGVAIDGQMQGSLGGMPVGFYASYANAAASTATTTNAFNSGLAKRSAFNFSTELGVIPEVATINFGMRRGKSGQEVGAVFDPVAGTYSAGTAGSNASDNAFLVGASYKLRQNIMLNFYYVSQSGDYWNTGNTAAVGSKETVINLATIF
jgi:hypothetical protein